MERGTSPPRRRRRRKPPSLLLLPLLLSSVLFFSAAAVTAAFGGGGNDGSVGGAVNLRLKVDKGPLRNVPSGSVRYTKLELTNTDDSETLIIRSMHTILPEEEGVEEGRYDGGTHGASEPLQIHVSQFSNRVLTLKPGQAAVVPIAFFPQFSQPPPLLYRRRGDGGGGGDDDGEVGDETGIGRSGARPFSERRGKPDDDAFWDEFKSPPSEHGADSSSESLLRNPAVDPSLLSPAAAADLVDLIGGSVRGGGGADRVGGNGQGKGGQRDGATGGSRPRPSSALPPHPAPDAGGSEPRAAVPPPAADVLFLGERDRVRARATLRVETSRGSFSFPLRADAVRSNAYSVPDAVYFLPDGFAMSGYLAGVVDGTGAGDGARGAAASGAIDSLRFRFDAEDEDAALAAGFRPAVSRGEGSNGGPGAGEGSGRDPSGRYEYDLYMDNSHPQEELRIFETFVSDTALLSVEHGQPGAQKLVRDGGGAGADDLSLAGVTEYIYRHRRNNCRPDYPGELQYCDAPKSHDSTGPVIIPATGKRAYVGTIRVVPEAYQNFLQRKCEEGFVGGVMRDDEDNFTTNFLGYVYVRTNMENFTIAVHSLRAPGHPSPPCSTNSSTVNSTEGRSLSMGDTALCDRDHASGGSLASGTSPQNVANPAQVASGGTTGNVPVLSSIPSSASFGLLTSISQSTEVGIDIQNNGGELLKLMRVTVGIDASTSPGDTSDDGGWTVARTGPNTGASRTNSSSSPNEGGSGSGPGPGPKGEGRGGGSQWPSKSDVGLRVDVQIRSDTGSAGAGRIADVIIPPNGGTVHRAIVLTCRSHITVPVANMTDAALGVPVDSTVADNSYPRQYRGTIVLRAGPASQTYDAWRRSVIADPNSEYHRSMVLEIPFTASVMHGKVEYRIRETFFPARHVVPKVGSATDVSFARHLHLRNRFPIPLQIRGLRVEGVPFPNDDDGAVEALLGHDYCRQRFRIVNALSESDGRSVFSKAGPGEFFEGLTLLYVFAGHEDKFLNDDDHANDTIDGDKSRRAALSNLDANSLKAAAEAFSMRFPKSCALVLTTDRAGETGMPLKVYDGMLDLSPEARAMPSVCSVLRTGAGVGSGGTKMQSASHRVDCLKRWYETSPTGRILDRYLQKSTDFSRNDFKARTATAQVIKTELLPLWAYFRSLANANASQEASATYVGGGVTMDGPVDPILLSLGALPADSTDTIDVYLRNPNPIPVTITALTREVEGVSLRLGRRSSESFLNELLDVGDDNLTDVHQSLFGQDKAWYFQHFLSKSRSARSFLAGLAYQDDIVPMADANLDLRALFKRHALVNLYRDDSSNNTSAATHNDTGDLFSCFSNGTDEAGRATSTGKSSKRSGRPWISMRGWSNSLENGPSGLNLGRMLLSAGGHISCPLRPISPDESSSDRSGDERTTWTLPPGSVSRFEVTVRSPPASALRNRDVTSLVATGPVLTTDAGQILPVIVSYNALLGTLELNAGDVEDMGMTNVSDSSPPVVVNVPPTIVMPQLCRNSGGKPIQTECVLSNSSFSQANNKEYWEIPLNISSTFSMPIVLTDLQSCNPWFSIELLDYRGKMNANYPQSEEGMSVRDGVKDRNRNIIIPPTAQPILNLSVACSDSVCGSNRTMGIPVGKIRSSILCPPSSSTCSFFPVATQWLETPEEVVSEGCGWYDDNGLRDDDKIDAQNYAPGDEGISPSRNNLRARAAAALKNAESHLLRRYGPLVQYQSLPNEGGASLRAQANLSAGIGSVQAHYVGHIQDLFSHHDVRVRDAGIKLEQLRGQVLAQQPQHPSLTPKGAFPAQEFSTEGFFQKMPTFLTENVLPSLGKFAAQYSQHHSYLLSWEYIDAFKQARKVWEEVKQSGLHVVTGSLRAITEYQVDGDGEDLQQETRSLSINIPSPVLRTELDFPKLQGPIMTAGSFPMKSSSLVEALIGDVTEVYFPVHNPSGIPVRVRLAAAAYLGKNDSIETDDKDIFVQLPPGFVPNQLANSQSAQAQRQSTNYQAPTQPWWMGTSFLLPDPSSATLMQSTHNVTIRSAGGAYMTLVNPSLYSSSALLVGCAGRRCGLRDTATQSQQSQNQLQRQKPGENDRWYSPLGAAAADGLVIRGHFYKSDGTEHPLSIAPSSAPVTGVTIGGRHIAGIANPKPFALPIGSQAEVVLPPFSSGRLGPLLFRPPTRGKYGADLFIENSLTGAEAVEVEGKGLWDAGVVFLDAGYGVDSGDVEVRYGMSALMFSGRLEDDLDQPEKLRNSRGVLRQVQVANLGDVDVTFDKVWLGPVNVAAFSHRAPSYAAGTPDKNSETFVCARDNFRILFCRDNATQIGDFKGGHTNILEGFTLEVGRTRGLYIMHNPDCTFQSQYVMLNLRYHTAEKRYGGGKKGPRKNWQLNDQFWPRTLQLLVGFDMTTSSSDFPCVPNELSERNFPLISNMMKAVGIKDWPYWGDGDSGGGDDWFERFHILLPNLLIIIVLLTDLGVVVWNSIRRQLGAAGLTGISSLTSSSSEVKGGEYDQTNDEGAKGGSDNFRHDIGQIAWGNSYAHRALMKSDPSSSELIQLGREQTRQAVLGRYRRMGGLPVGCLLSNGGFARERCSGGSSASASVKENGGRVCNISRSEAGKRKMVGQKNNQQQAVVTLSDAIFSRSNVTVQKSVDISVALPCGLGWREAARRGIFIPEISPAEGERNVNELMQKRASAQKAQREAARMDAQRKRAEIAEVLRQEVAAKREAAALGSISIFEECAARKATDERQARLEQQMESRAHQRTDNSLQSMEVLGQNTCAEKETAHQQVEVTKESHNQSHSRSKSVDLGQLEVTNSVQRRDKAQVSDEAKKSFQLSNGKYLAPEAITVSEEGSSDHSMFDEGSASKNEEREEKCAGVRGGETKSEDGESKRKEAISLKIDSASVSSPEASVSMKKREKAAHSSVKMEDTEREESKSRVVERAAPQASHESTGPVDMPNTAKVEASPSAAVSFGKPRGRRSRRKAKQVERAVALATDENEGKQNNTAVTSKSSVDGDLVKFKLEVENEGDKAERKVAEIKVTKKQKRTRSPSKSNVAKAGTKGPTADRSDTNLGTADASSDSIKDEQQMSEIQTVAQKHPHSKREGKVGLGVSEEISDTLSGGNKKPHKQLQQARRRWKLHQQKQEAQQVDSAVVIAHSFAASDTPVMASPESSCSSSAFSFLSLSDTALPVLSPPGSPISGGKTSPADTNIAVSKKGRNRKSSSRCTVPSPPPLAETFHDSEGAIARLSPSAPPSPLTTAHFKTVDTGASLGLPKSPAQSPIAPKINLPPFRPPPGLAPPPGFGGPVLSTSAPDVGAAEKALAEFDWGGSSSDLPILPPHGQQAPRVGRPETSLFSSALPSVPILGLLSRDNENIDIDTSDFLSQFTQSIAAAAPDAGEQGKKSMLATLLEEQNDSVGSLGVGGETIIGSDFRLAGPSQSSLSSSGFDGNTSSLAMPPLPIGSNILSENPAHAPLLGLGGGFNVMNFLDTILDESGQAEDDDVDDEGGKTDSSEAILVSPVEAHAVGTIGCIPVDPWKKPIGLGLSGITHGLSAEAGVTFPTLEARELLLSSSGNRLGENSQAGKTGSEGRSEFPRSSFLEQLVGSDDEYEE